MEGRIKYADLRSLGEYLGYGFNPEDVRWIVEWGKLCTLVKHRNYFGGDTDTLCEAFSAVHQAMTDGINLVKGLDEVLFAEDVEDNLHPARMVGDVDMALNLLAFGVAEGDEGVIDPDAFFVPRGQDLVGRQLNESELQGGATTVEDKYFHKELCWVIRCYPFFALRAID